MRFLLRASWLLLLPLCLAAQVGFSGRVSNTISITNDISVITGIVGDSLKISNLLKTTNALYYGFHPDSSATSNVSNLQRALDGGNINITVNYPGTYNFNKFFRFYSNTELIIDKGVQFNKVSSDSSYNSFLNAGSLTGAVDSNITIQGMNLITNSVAHAVVVGSKFYGLRGEIAFHNAKNIKVFDYTVLDLGVFHWGISFNTVEDFILEKFHIEGEKDAVSIQGGSVNWIVRDGIVSTYDDRIVVAGHGYPQSIPKYGDVTDGLIENITELDRTSMTGYCVRFIVGAWVSWYSGIQIRYGDTVEHTGNIYQAVNAVTEETSTVAPTHTSGLVTGGDGIGWVFKQADTIKTVTVKRVRFNNITTNGHTNAFANDLLLATSCRSVHPDTIPPQIEDILFDGITDSGYGQKSLFYLKAPIELSIKNVTPRRTLFRIEPVSAGIGFPIKIKIDGLDLTKENTAPGLGGDIRLENYLYEVDIEINNCKQDRDIEVNMVYEVRNTQAINVYGNASIDHNRKIKPLNGMEMKVNNKLRYYDGRWISRNNPNAILLDQNLNSKLNYDMYLEGTSGEKIWIDYGDSVTVCDTLKGTADLDLDFTFTGSGHREILITGALQDITKIHCSNSGYGTYCDLGQFARLSSLTDLEFYNNYDVYGDVSDLKYSTNLTQLEVYNTNISGDIADLNLLTNLTRLRLHDNATLAGKIDSLSTLTNILQILIYNTAITGNLNAISNFSVDATNITLYSNGDVSYTTATLKAWAATTILIQNNALSAGEVDQFLIDLAAASTSGSSSTLTINGTNAARTSSSYAAKTTLVNNGWTVNVNE